MPNEIKTTTVDTPPVTVTAISGAGEGRLVADTTAKTPGTQANLIVKVITPITQILARAARVFLQTLLGTLTAGTVTNILPAGDFYHLLVISASLSVASTVYCIIQNMIELLAKFDQTHPALAG